MLHLFRSNYLEVLGETLASKLESEPFEDPICSEWIAVNNPLVAQWVSERLALRLGVEAHRNMGTGICANVRFPLVSRCNREICAAILEDVDPRWQDLPDPWQGDALALWVQKGIEELAENDEFQSIAGYLNQGVAKDDALVAEDRKFSLARRIADVYQQYLSYRLDWLHHWSSASSKGLEKIPRWQPVLWNWLCDHIPQINPATRLLTATERLRAGDHSRRLKLPSRISFFGLHTLPPFQLEFLHQLGSSYAIDLYVWVPSHLGLSAVEAAADVRNVDAYNDAQLSLAFSAEGHEELSEHTLAVGLGRVAYDFQKIIEAGVNESWVVQDAAFVDPSRVAEENQRVPSLLERLQSDILHGRSTPRDSEGEVKRAAIRVEDDSVEIHACYGPMRQVEVLRERIVDALNRDPELETRDILILCPDLQQFAPLIATVFADGDSSSISFDRSVEIGIPKLPISIAEQDLRTHNPIIQGIWRLLELVHGRHDVSSIFDFLALEAVREKFAIQVEELPLLFSMVRASNIRWGRDGEHRLHLDGTPRLSSCHTWRHGLSQLLMSVAMSNEPSEPFFGIVPCIAVEGDRLDLLGRFVHFCETLFGYTNAFESSLRLGQWIEALRRAIGDFVEVPLDQPWLNLPFETVLAELAKIEGSGDWLSQKRISSSVLQSILSKIIDSISSLRKVGSSAIVCASIQQMAAIPHKLVCFLGMDDGRFPRTSPSSGFDGVVLHPRAGDRSLREDDRYAFLEALLATRSRTIILYGARDIRTRAEYPSAGPVADLMAVIERFFEHDPAFDSVRSQICRNHPLQVCDPSNFAEKSATNPRPLQSYDRRQFRAAQRLLEEPLEPKLEGTTQESNAHLESQEFSAVFMPRALPPIAESTHSKSVELDELRRFLINPSRYLMQHRLGLFLQEHWQAMDNRDPFELDPLQKWQLGDRWLTELHKGKSSERLHEYLRARGDLPIGTMGRYAWETLRPVVKQIVDAGGVGSELPALNLEIDVEVGKFRLQGQVSWVYADSSRGSDGYERRMFQFSKIHPRHRLSMWIDHLAWMIQGKKQGLDGEQFVSTLVARGQDIKAKIWRIGFGGLDISEPYAFAEQQLANVLQLWETGQNELVPLIEQSSEAMAKEMKKTGNRSLAVARALKCWEAEFTPQGGEGQDPYLQLAYGSSANIDFSRWIDVAQQVWGPLLDVEENFRG